jgi:8-oxo-dGTP pyrophosphatase MutT (NUDIX family)
MENNPLNSSQQIIASGGLFLAKNTKRFLFLLRTQGRTADTWGLVGGRKEPSDATPFEALKREIEEEIGKVTEIKKTIPLELFTSNDQNFQYNTYVVIVDNEFIPQLNEEHSGYAWCSYENWPKPLHQGLKASFGSKVIRAKLELLIDLLD